MTSQIISAGILFGRSWFMIAFTIFLAIFDSYGINYIFIFTELQTLKNTNL